MSKMSAVLKLLLLATVTLLVSAQGWSNYWSLPDLLRTHVNKALDKANRNFGGPFHVAYHKTLPNPRIRGSDFYVNVLLMVTTCKKDPNKGSAHRDECDTRKPRTPWIDCLVCKQVNGEQLVDCARQINVKNVSSEIQYVYQSLGSPVISVMFTEGTFEVCVHPRKETGSSFNWKVSKTTEAAHTKLANYKI